MDNLSFSGEFSNGNKKIAISLGIYLFVEDNAYIAYCPALDLSGYGDTEQGAKESFAETLRIYIDYCMKKSTLVIDLQKHGWNIKSKSQRKIKSPDFSTMMKSNKELRDIIEKKDYTKYSETVGIPTFA